MKTRWYLPVLAVLLTTQCFADVRNAAPVQGGAHYAVPFIAVYAFGVMGVGLFFFAFTCPRMARPFLLTGASICILFQYIVMMTDLEQYGDAFNWYDAFLLPPYVLTHPKAYSAWEHVVGLVIPCAFMIVSTLAIPLVWLKHIWVSVGEKHHQEMIDGQNKNGDQELVP